ncbi:MAG: methylenetetrahydrofolate reductase [NAD(P)H] [Clostridium sp.]|jgi:methylenetetrahydrofolate reductase (NADPH)|nr:methylenetetrahydrofolate reductase [NAD(P)H] [Clostridium sp.]
MIPELLRKRPTLSFEVFPPKKDGELDAAYDVLNALGALRPDFISVTYGAGGSRSQKTVEIASYIQNQLRLTALAHLTCVGSTKSDLLRICRELEAARVSHILALRGDRPKDMPDEQYFSREFTYASDMVSFLKQATNLRIAGACYPEKHYECSSMEADLDSLKAKQEAGAEFLITQLFFDNGSFYRFRELAAKKGITLPVCAGIMPVTAARQLSSTVSLSGSSVPKSLSDLIAAYGERPEDMRKAGIDFAIRQILDLKRNHADGIHLYTMNRPKMAAEIVQAIGN